MSNKRKHAETMEGSESQRVSPFLPMFEDFRAELDEHHDRRERTIKASRDITAASKKIIFSLQRARKLKEPLHPSVTKANEQHWNTIKTQYATVGPDLQGINIYRYARNITGGNQELMEALSFQHYLRTQTLITYERSRIRLKDLGGQEASKLLSHVDYLLGIYDMTGELMRFAITAMATGGKIPDGESGSHTPQHSSKEQKEYDDAAMDIDQASNAPYKKRDVLADMRELRGRLEGLEMSGSSMAWDANKKAEVMRQSVEKVEKALYGLVIRGRERPKGWMPDLNEDVGRREEVESY